MRRLLLILQILFFSSFINAFEWDTITQDDWEFSIPDSISIKHSAMIFEKIRVDDSEIVDNGFLYSLYRRIRIFESGGRNLANVQIPYFSAEFEIEEINGRVILRNGVIIELNDEHIFTKYILETNDEEIEQTFFYLPGVSSDCIIEYYIEYRSQIPTPIWYIEKEVYLKYGELIWDFYKGGDIKSRVYEAVREFLVPNYVIIHNIDAIQVEQIKDDNEVVELKFTTRNVPPFELEEYIVSPNSLKTQLMYFYQSSEESEEFWLRTGKEMSAEYREESVNDSLVSELKENLPQTPERQKVVEYIYDWVTKNIKNVDYAEDDKIYLINNCMDSVLCRRYGTSADINTLFFYLLNKLDVRAFTVFCLNRNDNIFRSSAKFWQFDHRITALHKSDNSFEFYDLSNKFLPCGFVDYPYEGTYAFIVGCRPYSDIYIHHSSFNSNLYALYDDIVLEKDLSLHTSFMCKYTGHFAVRVNQEIDELVKQKKDVSCLFENNPLIHGVDTVYIQAKESNMVSFGGKVDLTKCVFNLGDYYIFKPFQYVEVFENLGRSKKRNHPVQFDFAYNQKRVMKINLPENISIINLPSDSVYTNEVGECAASFTKIADDLLTITYSFTLKEPYINPDYFDLVIDLFEARKAILSQVILLTDNTTSGDGLDN